MTQQFEGTIPFLGWPFLFLSFPLSVRVVPLSCLASWHWRMAATRHLRREGQPGHMGLSQETHGFPMHLWRVSINLWTPANDHSFVGKNNWNGGVSFEKLINVYTCLQPQNAAKIYYVPCHTHPKIAILSWKLARLVGGIKFLDNSEFLQVQSQAP